MDENDEIVGVAGGETTEGRFMTEWFGEDVVEETGVPELEGGGDTGLGIVSG